MRPGLHKLLIALVLMSVAGFSQASAWCTYDKVTAVRTGGNANSTCFMSVQKGNTGVSSINICDNPDPGANDRNLSLAMAAMMSGKRIQIYSQSISSCDEIVKWFTGVHYLVVLAD